MRVEENKTSLSGAQSTVTCPYCWRKPRGRCARNRRSPKVRQTECFIKPKLLFYLALILSGDLFVFVSAACCDSLPCKPQPNQPLPKLEFHFIHMIDRKTGWAENARAVLITNHWRYNDRAMLRTTNGGKSWSYVLFADQKDDSMAACFYDAHTAWAVPTFDGATNVAVFHTMDGGRSWNRVKFTPPSVLLSSFLSFPDAKHGWLMLIPDHGMNSEPGTLYRTEDGAKQWELANSTRWRDGYRDPEGGGPGFANRHPYLICGGSIAFRDASVGWKVGSLTTTTRNFLFITRDGGKHWQLEPLPVPTGIHAGWIQPTGPPKFFPPDRQDGILPARFVLEDGRATNFDTVIYDSDDGGLSWQSATPVKFDGVWSFVSARQGWIWSPQPHDTDSTAPGKGTLYHTNDGGRSWRPVRPAKGLDKHLTHGQNIVQLDFVDGQCGWAIARDSHNFTQLLHTADGGKTWGFIQATIQP